MASKLTDPKSGKQVHVDFRLLKNEKSKDVDYLFAKNGEKGGIVTLDTAKEPM